MKELTIEATPENVDRATEFVDELLEEYGCGINEQMAIDVAVDELFANIAHYAYNPDNVSDELCMGAGRTGLVPAGC